MKIRVLVAALLFASGPLRAQDSLPPIVTRGLQFLVAGQTDSAMLTWTTAYTSEERQPLLDAIPSFERACIRVVSYDVLKVVELTPHLKRAYFVIRCQRQPMYLMLGIAPTDSEKYGCIPLSNQSCIAGSRCDSGNMIIPRQGDTS